MSLNELLRDNNSNKWSNLNVQSVTAITENVTNVNATTVNSIQTNTNREVIKAIDNIDHVIDTSKDSATGRIISKVASTGVLQPYEITASNLFWRKQLPVDLNETILAGNQLVTAGSLLPVFSGRYKMIFATFTAAGTMIAQSGGVLSTARPGGPGLYDITFNAFTNRFFCIATIAQDVPGVIACEPIDNTVVRVSIKELVITPVATIPPSTSVAYQPIDRIFTICAFGDA